jgi:undecaprenyl-diphosphatase
MEAVKLTIIQALVLGMVQGLTEFLPVSSSGHLVIFQHLFGIKGSPLTFDVLVHLGTLLAVFVAFWDDIAAIFKKPFSRLTYLIIVGCIPAGLMGFFLKPLFARAFESLLVVGIGLLITGVVLKVSEIVSDNSLVMKEVRETGYLDVLFIGLLQGIAIVPGISRSGSTIAGGLLAGLDRTFAARYSFLLSIPVILGAALVQLKDFTPDTVTGSMVPYIVGPLTAAVFGYFAIKIVLKLVENGRLSIFSYYCWIVGALTIGGYFFL